MTFSGQRISTLGQIDVQIFNEGAEVIQHPEFTVSLPAESRILGVGVRPEEIQCPPEIEGNRVKVRLPYLNPIGDHKQILALSLLVDGSTDPIKATGGGEGWSVRHVPLPTVGQETRRSRLAGFITVGPLFGIYIYGYYLQRRFGISGYEISWRAVLSWIPPVLIFGILGIWYLRLFRRTE